MNNFPFPLLKAYLCGLHRKGFELFLAFKLDEPPKYVKYFN